MRLWGLPLRGHGDSVIYTLARCVVVLALRRHLPLPGPRAPRTCRRAVRRSSSSITRRTSTRSSSASSFDRPLRFMAKKELFKFGPLGRLVGSLGAFPIDRGAGDRAALRDVARRPRRRRRPDDVPRRAPLPGRRGPRLPAGRRHDRPAQRGAGASRSSRRARRRCGATAARAFRRCACWWGSRIDLSDLTGRGSKVYAEAARRMRGAVAELYARL